MSLRFIVTSPDVTRKVNEQILVRDCANKSYRPFTEEEAVLCPLPPLIKCEFSQEERDERLLLAAPVTAPLHHVRWRMEDRGLIKIGRTETE